MAKGWSRHKKGATLFCWRNVEGMERSRTLGSTDMDGKSAWAKVGELGLDKLVANTDPEYIRSGELAKRYLAEYRFNKTSTKELHEQIINHVLLPRWSGVEAIKIGAKELKSWFLNLDVSDSTRGKYRTIMSYLFTWAVSEEHIPEFISGVSGGYISSNPCSRVKGPEFSQQSDYEALALDVEDTFVLLSHLKQPEYELSLLVATCGF